MPDKYFIFSSNKNRHMKSAPYHPQSNGQVERFVGTLKRALAKLKDEGNTKEILETFLQTYRSTPRENSRSPAELFLNRKIKTTLDLLKPCSQPVNQERDQKMETQFNKKHGAKDRNFKPKELVYAQVYQQKKQIWVPGSIVERVGAVNYNVYIFDETGTKLIRSHINQLIRRTDEIQAKTESIQLLLELFGIEPNIQNQTHPHQEIQQPLIQESLENQDDIPEENESLNSLEDPQGSHLVFSTPVATTPPPFSRPSRNRKPPSRYGFTD